LLLQLVADFLLLDCKEKEVFKKEGRGMANVVREGRFVNLIKFPGVKPGKEKEFREWSEGMIRTIPMPRTGRRNPTTRFRGRRFHQLDLRQGCFVLLMRYKDSRNEL